MAPNTSINRVNGTGATIDKDEVAITGISGRYPESGNIKEFWNNLLSGIEMYTESDSRWPIGYMNNPRKSGIIPEVNKFDCEYFGISNSIANQMDPQFRILHEVTYEALVDAGHDPFNICDDTSRTGVYIGYCYNPTTTGRNTNAINLDDWAVVEDVNSVSASFGIKGPLMIYDSACASTFSAFNEAFHAVKCGHLDTAIVSGVAISLRPSLAKAFRRLGMTSSDGRAYCLDKRAKGYVRAETVSTLILQRKSAAKRIYAIVANVKSNADGYKPEGITFPGLETQVKVMRETYQEANLDPKHVKYIEAHITGTQAGDVIECQAIESTFCPPEREGGPILMGCLKSNMGHSEGGSGAAALTKACLVMHHKLIPPNINFEEANPEINGIANGNLKPVTEVTKFDGDIISVDSFGFGGCNIHGILKSWTCEKEGGGNGDVHNLAGVNCSNRLILFKSRNESSFESLKSFIENEPQKITTEYLDLINNVAFLKNGHKMNFRGFFILDCNHKKIIECQWKKTDAANEERINDKPIGQVINEIVTNIIHGDDVQLNKLGHGYMNHSESENEIKNLFLKLYPTIKYPVSSGTPSISPLIKWNHEENFKVFRVPEYFSASVQRACISFEYGTVVPHLRGHQIDGRIIFPAMQYLQAVWLVFALDHYYFLYDIFLKTGIKFWNVSLREAIIITDPLQEVKIVIHADTSTGYFEVVHDGSFIMTGHAQLTFDDSVPQFEDLHPSLDGQQSTDCDDQLDCKPCDEDGEKENVLKKKDFYKELRIRGYDYEDKFQGVDECKIDGTGGKVAFLHNWVSFADAVLQTSMCNDTSRSLIVPTSIQMIQIDPSKFRHLPTVERERTFNIEKSLAFQKETGEKAEEKLEDFLLVDEEEDSSSKGKEVAKDGLKGDGKKEEYVPHIFNVRICKETKEIFSDGGLYIKGMDGSSIARRKANPVVTSHSFRPFDERPDHQSVANFEKRNKGYEEECIKLVDQIVNGKRDEEVDTKTAKIENGNDQNDDQKEGDKFEKENYSLIHALKTYEKIQKMDALNNNEDTSDKKEALIQYLKHVEEIPPDDCDKDGHDDQKKDETNKNEDLSMDTLLDVPIEKENEYLIHQLQLVGESTFGSKYQVIEYNASSRSTVKDQLDKLAFYMGSIDSYSYVGPKIITEKVSQDDGKSESEDGNRLEQYLKGIISSNCKFVLVQHPSLGFTFLDTIQGINDRKDHFKKGLKAFHDHSNVGTFVMILFRTSGTEIESKLSNCATFCNDQDSVFESSDDVKRYVSSFGWTIIGTKVIGRLSSILAKKVDVTDKVTKFEIDNFQYDWIEEIKSKTFKKVPIEELNEKNDEKKDDHQNQVLNEDFIENNEKFEWKPINDDPIYVITRGTKPTGINGLIRCLNKEDRRFRGIHIQESEDGHEVDYDRVLETCIKFGILSIYYRNGTLGSYTCHEHEPKLVNHVQVEGGDGKEKDATRNKDSSDGFVVGTCLDIGTKGDLSSLKYYKIKLPANPINGQKIVNVQYSALNFKDVMIASGRLPLSAYPDDLAFNPTGGDLGMEFSGVDTSTGCKIMGLTSNDAIASKILIGKSSDIVFNVPDHMSLEEAATIPVVYVTVYYALFMRGKIFPKESILIHAGSGGVGQAAINVCQSMGCEIFTTVGTEEKRQFIKSQFNIPDDHIFNSRSVSFADDLLTATNGRGADIVLNSLSEDKLRAGLNCLADGGRFIEIGKYDMITNSPFDPSLLTRNQSFHSICLAYLLSKLKDYSVDDQKNCPEGIQLRNFMNQGLKDGIVKPLTRTVFEMNQAEEAFRFMATGKHIGKVLINMDTEKDQNSSEHDGHEMAEDSSVESDTLQRVSFDGSKSYLVIGGLGGMGLEVCYWMILKGVRNLVTTSRTGIKNNFQKYCINRMKNQYNCNIHVSTLNVANYDEADELLELCQSFGPLGGVFNLAVVLSDALFVDQTAESFEKCCLSKVNGTYNLDQITRKKCPNLDHFICFSSVAGILGNVGQSNYGMANSFMDDVCEKRRKEGFNALSIAWGMVGDVGWVADNMAGASNVAGSSAQRINSCIEVMEQKFYGSSPNILSVVPVDGQMNFAKSGNIAESIYNILGVKDPSKLDPKTTLGELGLDSLMAVEMKQVLEKETGKVYSAKEIRGMTVDEVNKFSDEHKNKKN